LRRDSMKTRIETTRAFSGKFQSRCLRRDSMKTRIETPEFALAGWEIEVA